MATSIPTNTAAWLADAKAYPLEVKSAEYTHAGENEIVVRNAAVALNPVDCARQELGAALFAWTKYPTIIGTDVAGQVVEVGPGAERFKIGDRVLGCATGLRSNRPADGAFQTYVVLVAHMAAHIPETLSYESAATLPLCLCTAASGLFQKDCLALDFPTAPASPSNGKTLLIWGGSTSVGSNAIQLAVAAGYEVITTTSPRNFGYVEQLGASQAFDYNSPTVVSEIVAAFQGKESAGAYAIGSNSAANCLDIIAKVDGGNKFVALASYPIAQSPPGVQSKFVFGSSLKDTEVASAIFVDFLPKALTVGQYVAAPDADVVGKGLDSIQQAIDTLKKGVSAKKLVVRL